MSVVDYLPNVSDYISKDDVTVAAATVSAVGPVGFLGSYGLAALNIFGLGAAGAMPVLIPLGFIAAGAAGSGVVLYNLLT
jgi:hypothetical protein